MIDELSSLITLQKHDAEIDDIVAAAAAFDPQIQKTKNRLETLKNDLKTTKERLSANQLKKKQLELDAEAQQKLVQKHQAELNSLKSNDAYKAMISEIQAAKDAVVKIEDEILVVMEKADTDDKAYKELEKKFKTDEGAIKNDVQSLEAKKADLLSQSSAKKAERDEFAKTILPTTVARYEAIRQKRGGVAIVPLSNSSCGGCNLGLTQSVVNEIRRGKNMVICESCTRILYLPADAPAQAVLPPSPVSTPATGQ